MSVEILEGMFIEITGALYLFIRVIVWSAGLRSSLFSSVPKIVFITRSVILIVVSVFLGQVSVISSISIFRVSMMFNWISVFFVIVLCCSSSRQKIL